MRRRVLVVAPFAPAANGAHGGVRVLHGLVGALSRRHDVVVLHLDRHEIDPAVAAQCAAVHAVRLPDPGAWGVRARGAGAMVSGRSLKAAASNLPALRRRIGQLTQTFRPDVVQVEFCYLGDALRIVHGPLRVITVYDPAASLQESVAFRRERIPFVNCVDAAVARIEERRALARADGIAVFTDRDRRLIASSVPHGTALATIPLGCDVPHQALDPVGQAPPTVLFIGNFAHPPNVEAATALVHRIFPTVRKVHPDTRLELVGASPPEELRRQAGEVISVVGSVPSVTPYLDRAAVVVAPIAIGGGMRVKVLEALAAGKAVVASSRAAEGVSAVPGKDLVVVDGDLETASAINRLLSDGDARRVMGGRAREWAVRELAWSTMADGYDELYARAEHLRRAASR